MSIEPDHALATAGESAALLDALEEACGTTRFAPGAALRVRDKHYSEMYLIRAGETEVRRGGAHPPIIVGAGQPIGEIAFLRGVPASADVVATGPVEAITLDDAVLARLGRDQPELAVRLLRWLREVCDDRMTSNLAIGPAPLQVADSGQIEVLLCRDAAMLEAAQRLRYQVYCVELGRSSPNADHDRGLLVDPLDTFGDTFIARIGDEVIGTLRVNRPSRGDIGILEELYGMNRNPIHPGKTSICTKYLVARAHRRGTAALTLVGAAIEHGFYQGVEDCYIDCVPGLFHYYRAMGFEQSGEPFFHVENGISYPLRLDGLRYRKRLTHKLNLARKLSIYLRAKAIKTMDRLTGRNPPPKAPE